MGIGNQEDLLASTRGYILITPHGDRKPQLLRLAEQQDLNLITPHGDRKHMGFKYFVEYVETHYPSWGSETRISACRSESSAFSLPLMGIGNPTAKSAPSGLRASHYPSWGSETSSGLVEVVKLDLSLPLMGIGNTRPFEWRMSAPSASLPLMGIGNFPPTLEPAAVAVSLPLMGIGNRQSSRPGPCRLR